jgi:hypothetical protein
MTYKLLGENLVRGYIMLCCMQKKILNIGRDGSDGRHTWEIGESQTQGQDPARELVKTKS